MMMRFSVAIETWNINDIGLVLWLIMMMMRFSVAIEMVTATIIISRTIKLTLG